MFSSRKQITNHLTPGATGQPTDEFRMCEVRGYSGLVAVYGRAGRGERRAAPPPGFAPEVGIRSRRSRLEICSPRLQPGEKRQHPSSPRTRATEGGEWLASVAR